MTKRNLQTCLLRNLKVLILKQKKARHDIDVRIIEIDIAESKQENIVVIIGKDIDLLRRFNLIDKIFFSKKLANAMYQHKYTL